MMPAAARRLGRGALHDFGRARAIAGQAPEGQTAEGDAEAGRDVADGIEGAVVRDDLDDVAGARGGQPHPGGHRDAEVAPVAHPHGGRTVHEVGPVAGEEPRGVMADHPPVADGDEVGAPAHAVDGEVLDHPRDVGGAARVLDVEEDRAMGGGKGPVRRRR